jgi:hypothetical protein
MKISTALSDLCDVVINETKPRKGCFVIRIEGNESPVVELLNLNRPFSQLKALDLEEVIQSIRQQLLALSSS